MIGKTVSVVWDRVRDAAVMVAIVAGGFNYVGGEREQTLKRCEIASIWLSDDEKDSMLKADADLGKRMLRLYTDMAARNCPTED